MHTYRVDFYPKHAHARKLARSEAQSGHPDMNLSEFEIEVSELLHR